MVLGPGLFTIDENAYQTQADQLTESGRWAIPLVRARPGSTWPIAPLALSQVQGEVWYPYARHAAYPAAIAAVDTVVPTQRCRKVAVDRRRWSFSLSPVVSPPSGGRRTGSFTSMPESSSGSLPRPVPFLVHSQIGWAHLPAAAAFVSAFGLIQTATRWSAFERPGVVVGICDLDSASHRGTAGNACARHLDPDSPVLRARIASDGCQRSGGAGLVAFALDRVFFRWATGSVSLAPTGVTAASGRHGDERLQAAIALFLDVGGQSPQHVARLLAVVLLIAAAVRRPPRR